MTMRKRWLSLFLLLALSITAAGPVRAADPLANSFAAFLIVGDSMDFPQQDLSVEIYRRNADGAFQSDDFVRYTCQINRTAGDVVFYVQPQTDGVWVEVDYLTDLDQDGVYEMLDGADAPVSDCMTAQGALTAWTAQPDTLSAGSTYILSAQSLSAGAAAALAARNTPGSAQSLVQTAGTLPRTDTVLCLVSLHYLSPSDGEEYTLNYYLQVFESVIIPSDVPSGAWYYDAVEYVLERGLFSGTDEDSFSPGGPVTRAQLAQILWQLGGSHSPRQPVSFSDVSSDQWYYQAAAWCAQEGLMSGTGIGFSPNATLSREQLALILFNFTRYSGVALSEGESLSAFSDADTVSSWARESMEWAVGCGLLSGYEDSSLRPGSGITRAELAAALRAYCTTILAQ